MNRYSRQIILPNFGENVQQKLLNSKVLVVGAGGLGVPVLQYLASAGVGKIGVIDGDNLEMSNLQRQVLYAENEIGQNKAKLAVKKLQQLNSEVQFQYFDQFLDKSNVFEHIENYDIIVDCTDNFPTRYLVNDVCYFLQKPLVFASVFQFEAQLSVFHYGENSYNLRDVFAEIPDNKSVPNCNEAGVIGSLVGMVGSLQSLEVIKIITGIGDVISGKLWLYNGLNNAQTTIKINKSNSCFLPKTKEEILEKNDGEFCSNYFEINSAEQLKEFLQKPNSVLVDVRENEELPKISEFSTLEIPLSKLPLSMEVLEHFENLVVVCASGIRSKKAIDLLQKKYPEKTFYNVKDGINLLKK